MNRFVAAMTIALLALGAAIQGAGALEPPGFVGKWGVVFAGEKALELVNQCSRVSPGPVTGTWTPAQADIDAMEDDLARYVNDQAVKDPRAGGYWVAEYYRQYGGLIVGGRRIIYVNGFHKSVIESWDRTRTPSDVWRTQAVMICDGGPIVFGVEYDPATKAFANFSFNGSV